MITNNLEKTTKKTVSGNDFNQLVDVLCSLRRDYGALYDLYLVTAKNHEERSERLNEERDRYMKMSGKYIDLLKEFETYKQQAKAIIPTAPQTKPDQLDRDTLIHLERYEEVAELDRKKGAKI